MKQLSLFILYLFSVIASAQNFDKNVLSSNYFGFESGGDSWYLEHEDNFKVSSSLSYSGDYSLMFSCYDAESVIAANTKLKAYSGTATNLEGYVGLAADTFQLSIRIWISEDYNGTGFNFIIKEGWTSSSINFATLEREKWLDFSKEIVVDESVEKTRFLILVNPSDVGDGVFYLDDIQLKCREKNIVGLTTSFIPSSNKALNLKASLYELKMDVWVDERTDIESFYTIIQEPYLVQTWMIDDVVRNTWVELSQKIDLTSPVTDSRFEIKVSNHVEHGGGVGLFFIDNIKFEPLTSTVNLPSQDIGLVLYPNPAQNRVLINYYGRGTVCMYSMTGQVVIGPLSIENTLECSIASVLSGLYIVLLQTDDTTYSEYLLVE